MDNIIIENHSDLLQRIAVLRGQKDEMEDQLKDTFSEVVSTLNLVSVFEKGPKMTRPIELAKSGANMFLDIIVGLIMRKHRSIKGYLSAVLVEKVTTILIDNYLIKVIVGINSLFSRRKRQGENQKFSIY
jgi:hypothetical protein